MTSFTRLEFRADGPSTLERDAATTFNRRIRFCELIKGRRVELKTIVIDADGDGAALRQGLAIDHHLGPNHPASRVPHDRIVDPTEQRRLARQPTRDSERLTPARAAAQNAPVTKEDVAGAGSLSSARSSLPNRSRIWNGRPA